ncbi:hypothetical protein HK104_010648 [Borealophlyctis nickersoniae]|nr:hypothetical protein HK104_010648 [Borealophlyctis nickersoniae]
MRGCLAILDTEQRDTLVAAKEGRTDLEKAAAVVRRNEVLKAQEKYLELYDQVFQIHMDNTQTRPGSVAYEVDQILKRKREKRGVPDRINELKPTNLCVNDLEGTLVPHDDLDVGRPNFALFDVARHVLGNQSDVRTGNTSGSASKVTDVMADVDIAEARGAVTAVGGMVGVTAPTTTFPEPEASHAFSANGSSVANQPRIQPTPPQPVQSSLQNRYMNHVSNSAGHQHLHRPSTTTLASLRSRNNQAKCEPVEMDIDLNLDGRGDGRRKLPQKRGFPESDPDQNDSDYGEDTAEGGGTRGGGFISAHQKMVADNVKKGRLPPQRQPPPSQGPGARRRHLGTTSKRGKFVPPLLSTFAGDEDETRRPTERRGNGGSSRGDSDGGEVDERLRNIEPRMVETIMNEIMDRIPQVTWNDIAGLEHAKNTIMEIVVWPMLRPEIFTGLRAPTKGLLLFGPPGTGKTMIGKCIASQAKATFFSISSSSLTSKWIGDGEKMVRALFAVARVHQPSVIFVDEIDSLLAARMDGENDAMRRIKTEFLVQFDGCGTNSEDRILMIGNSATNRPHEIDEAARRRFRKKLYIPLPEADARRSIVCNLLAEQNHSLTDEDVDEIVVLTDGEVLSIGSDMDGLIREAALGPIRDIHDISNVSVTSVRPITREDFADALTQVRASVSAKDLEGYVKFDKEYGSISRRGV